MKAARDTWGGAESSGFGMRTRGAAFSQTEVLAEAIVPYAEQPPFPYRQAPYLTLH